MDLGFWQLDADGQPIGFPQQHFSVVNGEFRWMQMDLGFRQLDAEGRPIKRSGAEVAAIMGLPEKRWVKIAVSASSSSATS